MRQRLSNDTSTVTPGVCHEGEYEVHQTAQEALTTIWNQWPALYFGDQDDNLSVS